MYTFSRFGTVLFTTSETELDYYHQKVNPPVALNLRKLNEMKIDEMIGFNGEYPNGDLMQILLFVLENREKSALQTFHRETYYF